MLENPNLQKPPLLFGAVRSRRTLQRKKRIARWMAFANTNVTVMTAAKQPKKNVLGGLGYLTTTLAILAARNRLTM